MIAGTLALLSQAELGHIYSPGLSLERQRVLLAALEQARRWIELGIKDSPGASL